MSLYSIWLLRIFLFTLFPLFNVLFSSSIFAVPLENVRSDLKAYFESTKQDTEIVGGLVSDVYRENNFSPLWVDVSGPTARAETLYSFLKNASDEGLDPDDYPLSEIDSLWNASDSASQAYLDILFTTALHAYVSDVREGRVDPCIKNPDLFACARDRSIRAVDIANEMPSYESLEAFLSAQAPDTVQYRNLKQALTRYRTIEAEGGWSHIPDGPLLNPGIKDGQIPLIRDRLLSTGDLASTASEGNRLQYDETLVAAVKRFQKRHGLDQDGIIGSATRNAMNIPVSVKIHHIIANMERLRWISRDLSDRYVLVNIASFRLSVFGNSHFLFEMPVIVGSRYRKTPVFSGYIRYLDFNPYWNIPPFIAIMDILPKIKKDPSYLSERGIRIFDGWNTDAGEISPSSIDWNTVTPKQMGAFKLRQDPGPLNPLGRVKFMFPNRFAVYLHDSPAKELFEHTERTFSSGCIRVSQPVKLASYLLGGEINDWDESAVQEIIDKGNRDVAVLDTPVPVHIIYLTVCVGPDSLLYFNRDVYGRDDILEKTLFKDNNGI